MLTAVAILIIILSCIIYFCLRSPVLTSCVTAIAATIGIIVAFNYYEILANMLISRGYVVDWALSICFFVLFIVTLVVLRAASDQIVRKKIKFGQLPTWVVGVICGLIVGIIVSGTLVIAVSMGPLNPKWPYARFDGSKIKAGSIQSNKSIIADSLVSGLFSLISKGSLSSDKSFAVYHADFIDQLHLNRIKAGSAEGQDAGITTIAGSEAVVVPVKVGVRIRDDNRTVIRMGIKSASIKDGGASKKAGVVKFTLSQVRLICKKKDQIQSMTGSGVVVFPEQYSLPFKTEGKTSKDKEQEKVDLSEKIEFSGNDFVKRVAWIDLVFSVPSGHQGVLLEFKQNAVTKLPNPVNSTEEIEQQLNEKE